MSISNSLVNQGKGLQFGVVGFDDRDRVPFRGGVPFRDGVPFRGWNTILAKVIPSLEMVFLPVSKCVSESVKH